MERAAFERREVLEEDGDESGNVDGCVSGRALGDRPGLSLRIRRLRGRRCMNLPLARRSLRMNNRHRRAGRRRICWRGRSRRVRSALLCSGSSLCTDLPRRQQENLK